MALWGAQYFCKVKAYTGTYDVSPLLPGAIVQSQNASGGDIRGEERGNKIFLLGLFGRGSGGVY